MQSLGRDLQRQAAAAVVVPTVLRPSLLRAVRSVYAQDLDGPIHLLIGIDKRMGEEGILAPLAAERPDHVTLTVFDPGYSTAHRHGGCYANAYSGALRTILSYAANSRFVAYLDDDDWWAPDHLSGLKTAIAGKDWAFSYRWFADRDTGWTICRDEWDSLGPGQGINQRRFGGFACPSTVMLDKEACHFVLPYWSLSPFEDGSGEDRLVFQELLKNHGWAASGRYSCFYELRPDVMRHEHHAREFKARGLDWMGDAVKIERIRSHAALALAALGREDREGAIENARAALAVNPHHQDAAACLARAEALPR